MIVLFTFLRREEILTSLTNRVFYHNTFSDWIISIGIIVAALIAGKIIFWVFKKVFKSVLSKTKNTFDDVLIDMLDEPFVFSIISWGFYIAVKRLKLPQGVSNFVDNFLFGFISLMATWFLARMMAATIELVIVPLAKKTESDFDDHLVPVIKKASNLGIWTLGIIVGLNNAGFDVGALIAGMGIGGLAIAMAAKDTISNFFGGVTVFIDRPFKLGDRIKINGIDGTVTEIGLRSTRIKTLERRIVTIPNAKFSDGIVENVTLEPHRKVVINLGLTYDTTHEQMQNAMKILHDIVLNKASTEDEDDISVSFDSWGDFSLGITLVYYIRKGEDIFKTQSDVNLEILEKFNAAGLNFAFPTQTVDIPSQTLEQMSRR